MAAVNCYLPDALKSRAERELPATFSFSEVLRRGLLAALGEVPPGHQSDESAADAPGAGVPA